MKMSICFFVLYLSLTSLRAQNSYEQAIDTLYFTNRLNPEIKIGLPVANEEIKINYKNGNKDYAYIIDFQNDTLKFKYFSELSNVEYYQWKIDSDTIQDYERKKKSLQEAKYKNVKHISMSDISQIEIKYSSYGKKPLLEKIGGIFFVSSIYPIIILSILYILPFAETEHFILYYIIGATIFIDWVFIIYKGINKYKLIKPEEWSIKGSIN